MNLILIDCGNSISAQSIEIGLELGFTSLITYVDERIAQDCRSLGMRWIPILPQWSGFARNESFAFRDADGTSSYSAEETRTPGKPASVWWPCFWHPAAAKMVRPQFARAAQFAGGQLDGAVITTSVGESIFPTYWYGHPEATKMATRYWCHSDHAKVAWRKLYGADSLPAARPEDDEDNRTLQFCQDAMIGRLDELAEMAAEYAVGVYPLIMPYGYSWSHLHRAAGYSGIEARLEKWKQKFFVAHSAAQTLDYICDFAFALTSVYLGGPAQIAYAAGLCDSAGLGWSCWIGAEVGAEVGEHKWQNNLLVNGRRSQQAGFSGLICGSAYILQPKMKSIVKGILAAL